METKKVIPDWRYVEEYFKKENKDSIRLAVLEAEKIFLKIVEKKGYRKKKIEDKISLAVSEINNPESFIKARNIAKGLKEKINFDIGDLYNGEDIVSKYKSAIEDLVYGEISGEKSRFFKFKLWPLYYYILLNSKKILKILLWIIFVIVLILFIADTSLGRELFIFFVDKIHFIIRIILAILLIIFAIAFFIVLFIVILESRGRKRSGLKK